METDGGGWMLALNYAHKTGTDPDLAIRSLVKGPPLLGATDAGADESNSSFAGGSWGHLTRSALAAVRVLPRCWLAPSSGGRALPAACAAAAVAAALAAVASSGLISLPHPIRHQPSNACDLPPQADIGAVRFYGRSSEDPTRTLHFKTTSAELVSYLTNYTAPVAADFETRKASLIAAAMPLVGHEANLPGGITELGREANNEMALTYGLFTGAESRSWRVRGPNAANSTAPFWSMDDTATTTRSTLHQVWVRPPGVEDITPAENATMKNFANCAALKAVDASALSGVYVFNINSKDVRVYCDMVTEGGGWMLVLNYVRGGGLTPALHLRDQTTGFPLLRSTRLGTDESWMHGDRSPWGHVETASLALARAAAAALHALRFLAVR
jgi:hypothetical protein